MTSTRAWYEEQAESRGVGTQPVVNIVVGSLGETLEEAAAAATHSATHATHSAAAAATAAAESAA